MHITSNYKKFFTSLIIIIALVISLTLSPQINAQYTSLYNDNTLCHVILSSSYPSLSCEDILSLHSLQLTNISLIYEFDDCSLYEADIPFGCISSAESSPLIDDIVTDESFYNSVCTTPALNDLSLNDPDLNDPDLNDPDLSRQWYLDTIGFNDVMSAGGYKAAAGTTVAIIDSGAQYTHPDLIDNIWTNTAELNGSAGIDDDGNGYVDDIYGYDFTNDDSEPLDDTPNSHGTHIAGVIGMTAGNSTGGAGIAYNSKLMILKASDSSGNFSISKIIKALSYAVDNGADVINLSFGAIMTSSPTRDKLEEALNSAAVHCPIFAAAGNKSLASSNASSHGYTGQTGDYYPAAFQSVTGVMSSDSSNSLSAFSNWSYTSESDSVYELIAPGDNIYSTFRNNTYAYSSGTSISSPIAASMAAALISECKASGKSYNSALIQDVMINSSSHYVTYTAADDSEHAFIMPNLKEAIEYINKTEPERPQHTATPEPSPTHTCTPAPVQTSTPVPVHTGTPAPAYTNTPVPVHTATPAPAYTNTPVPVHTGTPAPAYTNTPVPMHTGTPTSVRANTPAPVHTSAPAYKQIYNKIKPKLSRKVLHYGKSKHNSCRIRFRCSRKKYLCKYSYNKKHIKIVNGNTVIVRVHKKKTTILKIKLTNRKTGKKYSYEYKLYIKK